MESEKTRRTSNADYLSDKKYKVKNTQVSEK